MRWFHTLTATVTLALAGCQDSGGEEDMTPPGPATPVEEIALADTINDKILSAPVDVVRDEWGVPHIYGATIADVAFAQGYVMAMDRLVQMDLARHKADGSLAELVGGLFPSTINDDIVARMHHRRATAQAQWDELRASSDEADRQVAAVLTSFAAGINAYVRDLNDRKYDFPSALFLTY